MYVMIQTTIGTVYVHIHGRINHGMIKRSVEHRLLIRCTFYFEMIQFIVPVCPCSFRQLFEALSGSLGTQVLYSAFRADCRQGYLYNQFGIFGRFEVKVSHDLSTSDFREILLQLETTPKAIVQYLFLILISVILDRL